MLPKSKSSVVGELAPVSLAEANAVRTLPRLQLAQCRYAIQGPGFFTSLSVLADKSSLFLDRTTFTLPNVRPVEKLIAVTTVEQTTSSASEKICVCGGRVLGGSEGGIGASHGRRGLPVVDGWGCFGIYIAGSICSPAASLMQDLLS